MIIWLWIGLNHGGLGFADMKTRAIPNQGIMLSAKNSIFTGLIIGLIFGITGEIILWNGNGLIFGVIGGLIFGGLAVIQHFALRFILYRKGLLPWRLVTFLDYATERIFLRKVGGGYVFVHRMLMEYFASQEPGPGRK